MMATAFSEHRELATALLPHATDGQDGSHDVSHIVRVWKNAFRLHASEGGDPEIIAASVLLHDCVSIEKTSPERKSSSAFAARKAAEILRELNWPPNRISEVAHAVEAHSFSAGIAPTTIEAKILQDADRLDAIGMIGVARCFYVAGRGGQKLYHIDDPGAVQRTLNEDLYSIDHFATKLLKLASSFQTRTGRQMAEVRDKRIRRFLAEFLEEL